MSKYPRSISEGNFMDRASIDSRNIIKKPPHNLISLPKDIYTLFNQFQLTQSRLSSIKEYQLLVQQIKSFNVELSRWKQKEGPQIKNLRSTYNCYQNLYSRIKCVNEHSSDKQSAKVSLTQIIKWFAQEKPKVRGVVGKGPQPILKPSQADLLEELQLKDMSQFNNRKRQMLPYEKMARTSHTGFFPPKERLLDYHKKQFIMDPKLTIDQEELRQTRLAHTASMKRTSFNDGTKLRQTATTFRNTKATFRQTSVSLYNSNTQRQSIKQQIKEVRQPQNDDFQKEIQIKQFTLGDQPTVNPNLAVINNGQVNKNVQQQEMMNELINGQNFEEDDKDEYLKGEDDEFEEQPGKNKYKKVFQVDHKRQALASYVIAAEENIKDQQQSTLRRLLRSKQMEIQHKLEDLNIKEKMLNWAKTASFINRQINRKSQTYRCVNDFQRTEFKKKGFFEKRKQIPEFDFKTERAKTVDLDFKNIQQSCDKRKIDNTLKSFGKYISSHVKINPISHQAEQNSQLSLMRATSLTAFNRKAKRTNFGDILAANNVDLYNEEAENEIISLKDKLSKKSINVNKKKIFSALTAVKTERLEEENIFPKTLGLLSNPFFPKHLYEKKKKKKK